MLFVIPLLDTFIKYIFLFGVSLYSYGISYIFILKNIFYMLTILNTFLYIITLFKYNYFTLLWDSFMYGILTSNLCSLMIFIVTFGFLMICDFNDFIDNNITLKIPLINMTYITFQSINGSYNISLNNNIETQILPHFIKDILQKYNIQNVFEKYVISKFIVEKEEDKEDKEDDEEDLTNYILIKTSLTEYKIAKEGDKYKSGEKEIIIKNVKYSTTDDFMMNFKVLLENEANQMVTDLVANKIVKNKTLAKKQVLEELKFKVSNKSIKILNGSEEELIEKINNFK